MYRRNQHFVRLRFMVNNPEMSFENGIVSYRSLGGVFIIIVIVAAMGMTFCLTNVRRVYTYTQSIF